MDRLRAPTEFGFTTGPYVPPERPRPLWPTLLFLRDGQVVEQLVRPEPELLRDPLQKITAADS